MRPPLRIVHLLPDLARGGGQVIVRTLIAEPRDDLHHEVVALGDGPMRAEFEALCPVHVVVVEGKGIARLGAFASAVRSVSAILDEVGADVVHTNNTPADKLVGALAAGLRRTPVVNSLTSIATSHQPRRPDEPLTAFAKRRAGNLANRVLVRAPRLAPAALTALSDTVRASHARALRLPTHAVEVVPPGIRPRQPVAVGASVSVPPSGLRGELALGDAFPVVISVGRVEANKGQLDLLEVARLTETDLPEALFLVVGDGPDLGELHRRIAEGGLSHRFRVLGQRTDVDALLDLADLFVSTARAEGFGFAALEALAAGVPVVAYTGPAIAIGEFVEAGRSGELVPLGDLPGLSRAIVHLGGNPMRLAELGNEARAAARRHSSAAHAEALATIYARVAHATDKSHAR